MIELLVLGAVLLTVATVGVALLEVLIRRADVGAALVLAMAVLSAVLIDRVPAVTTPGGVSVQLPDLVFTLILSAATLRLLRVRRFSGFQRCLVLLAILLLLSLMRGAAAFGVEHSVAEARLYVPFVSVALYFAAFPPSTLLNDRIGKVWLAMSVPMVVLVCLRWLAIFAGIDLGVPAETFGADAAIKVLDGPYTFFLANALVLTVPFWLLRDGRARRLTRWGSVLVLFVVLLNRRTVWLALLAGIAVILLRNRRLGRRAVMMVAAAAVVTAAAYVHFSGAGTGEEPVAQSAAGTDTLDWRIEGGSALYKSWSGDPAHWFVGQPFGSGFARDILGSEEQAEPHNFYFLTMLRAGVVGLLLLLALTGGLLRALWRTPTHVNGLLAPGVFPALLVMQLIWFMAWVPGMEQGIVTGLAIGLVASGAGGHLASRGQADGQVHAASAAPSSGT
jgi:hypothetical protein